jgi:endonuclease/exonuclease/phosphatase family metal-dependent hydrolase
MNTRSVDPKETTMPPSATPSAAARTHDIRILTLNLNQRFQEWPTRRAVLVAGIRALHPDIVAFQEAIKDDKYDQAIDLLGPDFNVVHHKSRDPNGMGISLASRWPLGEVQEVDLNVTPRTAGFPCSTLLAEIIAPMPVGPLLIVNHFPNWQLNFALERELQSVVAARFVEEHIGQSNKQVVMVGDLDDDSDSSSIRFWSGRQSLGGMSVCYRDAWDSTHPGDSGHTFTPLNPLVQNGVVKGMRPFRDWPFRRIDYIFVRFAAHGGLALDVLACERVFGEPVNGVWASDHFGLVADFAHPRT